MSKRNSEKVPFWRWSNWLGAGTRVESLRTHLNLFDAPVTARDRVCYGHGPIAASDVPLFKGNLEYKNRVEDCPWPVQRLFVVSDRVRRILEAAAPGNCQFFPIELWHNGDRIDLIYWTLYVDSIDCADPAKSGWNDDGTLMDFPVIADDRVPPSVSIFRIWEPVHDFSRHAVYVRDELRRRLQREKVTGCYFDRPQPPSPDSIGRGPKPRASPPIQ